MTLRGVTDEKISLVVSINTLHDAIPFIYAQDEAKNRKFNCCPLTYNGEVTKMN